MQLKLQTPQFCKTEYNRNKNKGAGETRSVDGQTLGTNLLNPNAETIYIKFIHYIKLTSAFR